LVFRTNATDINSTIRKFRELDGKLEETQSFLKTIQDAGDNFSLCMEDELNTIEQSFDKLKSDYFGGSHRDVDELEKKYKILCDDFKVEKTNELRDKSKSP
jgi:hypothetical protein